MRGSWSGSASAAYRRIRPGVDGEDTPGRQTSKPGRWRAEWYAVVSQVAICGVAGSRAAGKGALAAQVTTWRTEHLSEVRILPLAPASQGTDGRATRTAGRCRGRSVGLNQGPGALGRSRARAVRIRPPASLPSALKRAVTGTRAAALPVPGGRAGADSGSRLWSLTPRVVAGYRGSGSRIQSRRVGARRDRG